jgi:hypothetical protein
MAFKLSTAPAAANAQQAPHLPWNLTLVTHGWPKQSFAGFTISRYTGRYTAILVVTGPAR